MKLSFSERDEFGNGRGVIISLPSTVTPRQILAIGRCYEKIGWQPSRRTKRALDAAKAAIKLARSTKSPRK